MKIVEINSVCEYSSTGRIVSEIRRKAIKENDQITIFYGEKKGNFPDAIYIGNILDHKLHGLMKRPTGLTGYFSKGATKKLLKELRKIKPDLVHLHNLHSNYVNIPMLLNYLKNNEIPTVITLHDCFLFTGRCYHYTSYKCDKWLTQCNQPCPFSDGCSNKNVGRMFNDKKEIFKDFKNLYILSPSKWGADEARKSILKNAKLIDNVYNWVDLSLFKPSDGSKVRERYNIGNKFMILGVSSGWNDKKGISDFVELAGKLGDDCQIVLIGRQNRELPKNILSIPEISPKDLVDFYSAADCFVSASREETFGLVIAEAMACGTPAIVYDTTACPEVVGPGCGYVVPLKDVDAVIGKIREIKEKGKESYSKNCISFVHENFDKEKNLDKLWEIYRMATREREKS